MQILTLLQRIEYIVVLCVKILLLTCCLDFDAVFSTCVHCVMLQWLRVTNNGVHIIQNGSCASIEIRDPDVPVVPHNSTGIYHFYMYL